MEKKPLDGKNQKTHALMKKSRKKKMKIKKTSRGENNISMECEKIYPTPKQQVLGGKNEISPMITNKVPLTHKQQFKDFDPSSSKYEELNSIDDAEALVTSFPNSSKAWLMYMACCLKQAEVNRARGVAHRALTTINFREDSEKLNIWKALLNLENNYGTEESLEKVLKEAVLYNDQMKIYYHMIDAYTSTAKTEALENLSQIVLKKFKTDKEVWIKLITYYMQSGKQKEARNTYSRSLQCLPSKEHTDVMGKLAHLEYKYGDLERSLNMFEEILVKYPKRKDLRSVYIHLLKEQGQHERANILTNYV